MAKFNITSEELADALEIELSHLIDICEEFDRDPDDAWELIQGTHFEWGTRGSRIFSPEGAVEICNYLEENYDERPVLQRWKRWLLRRDQRLKGLMIAKQIQESSESKGQIIFRSGKAFLAPRACREVLGIGTRQDVLNRTFNEIQLSENTELEPLEIDRDFYHPEPKICYFSGTGIAVVSKQLGKRLTQKHRKAWVEAVAEYAPKALMTLERNEADRGKAIQKAMANVHSQAKRRCQITNRHQAAYKFNLEVHHLFDRASYPQLAAVELNLIAIGGDIHSDFHKWLGGCHVSCTIEDMERYIQEFGSSLFADDNIDQATKVAIHLSQAKKMLRALL